jgi:feruloyl esterase
MQWTRDIRAAGRGLRTAIRAASAIAKAQMRTPQPRPGWAIVPTPDLLKQPTRSGIAEWRGFGSNPGHLAMLVYTPPEPPLPGTPLIVVLHGCGQSATDFAAQAGWVALADRLRVPLVLPEQSDDNNRGRCFNWFRPVHIERDLGEAQSIQQMVGTAVRQFDADPERVFVTGLSAGGAMTAALLAADPDVFAAGAVVAGLPVGAATGAAQALARMAQAGPERSAKAWGDVVRDAAPTNYSGLWPRISIWRGMADVTVDPANGELLATQWSDVHGLDTRRSTITSLPTATRETWGSAEQPAVELWTLPGIGHVWPDQATRQIATFWGLD